MPGATRWIRRHRSARNRGAVVATSWSFDGWYADGESAGIIASVVGAVLLLVVYRLFRKRQITA